MATSLATSTSLLSLCLFAALSVPLVAQPTKQPQSSVTSASKPVASPTLPKDYVIGVEDILNVVFWREKDMSAEVRVRPDGKISLPVLNDVPAAGLTPEQLAAAVQTAATKFVRDAGATVIVKEIRSRKVYVIGEVVKPGTFQLGSELNVLQIIAEAGGFLDHANKGNVVVVRNENGQEHRYTFNYNDVVRGKNVQQNIRLVPGDTILIR
jgi:polysaccharide export outer membrane protein